jgi:hypothetical protein
MAKQKIDIAKAVWLKTKSKRRTKPKHLRHSKSLNKHDPNKGKRS